MVEKLENILNSRKNNFKRLFLAYIIPDDHSDCKCDLIQQQKNSVNHTNVNRDNDDSSDIDTDKSSTTSADVDADAGVITDNITTTSAYHNPPSSSFFSSSSPSLLKETSMWLLEVAEGFHVINVSTASSLIMGIKNKIFLCFLAL